MSVLPDRPLIKICGLRDLDGAQATADVGADLIGFVFAPSKRQVTADDVRPIVDALTGEALPVGLFVDEPVDEINRVAKAAGLPLLQVHWRQNEEDLLALELPYMLVRRTEPNATYDTVAPDLERVLASQNPPVRVLVDSYHPGASGGTGVLADWDLAAQLARSFPVVLAGGLNPENVASAIETVEPVGVDVSSGVERDGVKAVDLIEAFVANARVAFDREIPKVETLG
ncbi:MAG: phosphoribosylanthranilate isomerase [Thermomicrobiales bacterium]|nr:phosphoribosylanthranilate isomerase [Thermomicrobiales bacterium]